jgi:hypothetical protein
MVDQNEIIGLLEKAVYWEESFIMKYDTESTWALLKTLPKDKFAKIKKLLSQNIADTQKHYKITRELVEKIKNGKYEL